MKLLATIVLRPYCGGCKFWQMWNHHDGGDLDGSVLIGGDCSEHDVVTELKSWCTSYQPGNRRIVVRVDRARGTTWWRDQR